ncbi:hypothetical protein AWC38_SpisGene19934 [Stylophora pistillata]|uniref:ZSWIM1/3 RNaseH-like domain-containing protein n=1 Tax=Stylophora pistillata TaxID=50429 RepID=A0A2B4RF77_STYPI|nr:hypothetical protein AWC38_SpisGene19934 [Stylophora pistillata]
MRIPLSSLDNGHPVGETAGINQNLDRRIISKTFGVVGKGITNVGEVRRCVADYAEKELFRGVPVEKPPRLSNRRYHPTKADLRNHISRAIAAQKYCKDDQESLRKKIEEWKEKSPSTKFFFRPHKAKENKDGDETKGSEENQPQQNFLFVHQEEWQQRLLQRYGSELVFMDVTYKTTKYAIPLFFICVRTNVDYKVAAEFMTQYEDQWSISEALVISKSWNPLWQPNYFMVDFSTVEIGPIEEQFPGAIAYICDFRRLQAWQRWAIEEETYVILTHTVIQPQLREYGIRSSSSTALNISQSFNVFRKDRSTPAGGVLAYVHSSIPTICLENLEVSNKEVLRLLHTPPRIPRPFSCIIMADLYFPPGKTCAEEKELIDHVTERLDNFLIERPSVDIIITGDFNHLNLRQLCHRFSLCKLVKMPTRGQNSILHKFLSNMGELYRETQFLPPLSRSDHQCILFSPLKRRHGKAI